MDQGWNVITFEIEAADEEAPKTSRDHLMIQLSIIRTFFAIGIVEKRIWEGFED
ncbi:19203_t:CDS:2 [Funneliformis geosporum]|uniref:14663_t:CDS:1 n=1 Tax=Funneliformis geosporum TaxID=1117311 RepID=A0A9W4SHR0_9GLOM|nr:14663_t:CDS:2 [Funneliformis geosporum]CAI2172226.1 19203_t:CDS:2 [Funneliformis geosporum]